MAYLSLYRKYRSQTFGDLIGQDHVVRTLQNGIATSRIAHSYLFTGPRGTGKTSSARLLAKALCCEKGPIAEPCNECEICRSITEGSCADVLEMDAASESGVDEVRERIVEAAEYQPMFCRYKVFIIDEVHDLSAKAFDALLKTIEEPPPHVVFILATTEYSKVPPTIRSRCQKFEFHRARMNDLTKRIEQVAEGEGVTWEPAAITAIARMADGGYRDALTLLEQAILTAEDGRITLAQVYDQLGLVSEEVVDSVLLSLKQANVPGLMEDLAEIARRGRDPRAILESLMFRLSDLTRASYEVASGESDATRVASMNDLAVKLGRETILRLRSDLADAHRVIRDITLPRIWLEAELIRIALNLSQAPTRAETAVVTARPAPSVVAAPPPAKPTPRPEPEKPAPMVSETEAPAATSESPSGPWGTVYSSIAAKSRTAGLRLKGTRLISQDDRSITVEFDKNIDLEWVQGKPALLAEIHGQVAALFGRELAVKYVVSKREISDEEPVTVELPLEGQDLVDSARAKFAPNKAE